MNEFKLLELNYMIKQAFKKFVIGIIVPVIIILIMLIIFTSNIQRGLYDSKIEHLTEESQYLTDRDYLMITQNYGYYSWAATKCDIPVELMIAIHHRECRLHRGYYSYRRKIIVHNLGGPFMLDCGGEGTPDFEANIRHYEHKIAKKYNYKGDTRVSHNFEFACLVAANEIKNKTRYGLDTERGIADTFWGYNGRVHKSYLDSAYVCSDPKNGNVMSFFFKGKRTIDTNPGCLAILKELKNSKKLKAIALKYDGD